MKNKNWFWGLFFILAAVVIVGGQFASFGHIGFWSIVATVLLAAWIVHSLIEVKIAELPIPVALLYAIYQGPLGLYYLSPWVLIAAAIFLSIGLSMIFQGRFWWVHHGRKYKYTKNEHVNGNINIGSTTESSNEDDNPHASVTFSSASKYIHTNNLQSGTFSTSFGTLEVYLDQAQLSPNGAEIRVDCNFGELTLFVPKHWRVINHVNSTLGEVSVDSGRAYPQEDAPVLTLTGSVHLGEFAVRFI